MRNGQSAENIKGGGLPPPASEEDQDFLIDVWKQVLMEVLAMKQDEWELALRTIKAEALATSAEMRACVGDVRTSMEHMIEERLGRLRTLTDEKNGPRVHPYIPDKIHYEGELVAHNGSCYQALKDTAKEPPHDDWICIAAAARSPRVRGTYCPEDLETYRALDIVALNGASFIARHDGPGECPGGGWQAMALSGRKGPAGPKGDRGERGLPGLNIAGWKYESESYTLTPLMAGGYEGPPVYLRPFFEQYDAEKST